MNDLCATYFWHCGGLSEGPTFRCCGWLAAVKQPEYVAFVLRFDDGIT